MKNVFKRAALGGAVPHRKHTAKMETVKMPVPSKVVLPMIQHIGAPAAPTVKKGGHVYVGTLVGEAGGFVSADIHSSVSGEVSEIADVMLPSGVLAAAVVITPDGLQQPDPAIHPPVVTDYETFVAAVRKSGLVGLGGAGFPTAVKLSPKNLAAMDTLIINGAECEPYITADDREFLEHAEDVMAGIAAVQKYLGIQKVIIAIERNKPEAIDLMFSLTKGVDGVTVKPLKSKYPQGAEKILIESCTGREVPQGGLPADVGVLVMNVASVSFVSKYLKTGMPLVSKRLTVDGELVKEPKNVEVCIGTPYREVFDFCGGLTGEPGKIIMGGPMMGTAVMDMDFPVLKQNNALLAFSPKTAHLPEPGPCIRCARCIVSCPMGLSPVEIAGAFTKGDADGLHKLKTDICIECGTCTYVCPAKRPVTQTMRLAKQMQKQGGKK